MGEPPLSGAVNEMVAEPLPERATRLVGASGAIATGATVMGADSASVRLELLMPRNFTR